MINYFFKRFKNPPGGPGRNFNPLKWLAFFLRRLFDRPIPIEARFLMTKKDVRESYSQLANDNTITWLGHSTFIVKFGGTTILTDPFLSDYASPIPGIGPKRYTPPGLDVIELPHINIIIVSHNHYDHLDIRTISSLDNKADIDVIVPLKLGDFFKKLGYRKIHELDWHDSISINNITIRALPAYHYSKRYLFSRNTTLWASFAIYYEKKQVYFSGDTAYGPVFLDIGRDYGPFSHALLSIGAYMPPELMLTGHLSPELAVRVGQDLRAKVLVAMHWGTISLSDEPSMEPPERFYKAAISAHYLPNEVWVLKIGETRKI